LRLFQNVGSFATPTFIIELQKVHQQANTVRRCIEIVWTTTIIRSGINAFYLSNCIHEQETGVRRAFVQNKTGCEERSFKLHFFTASFYGFKSNSIFSWQPNLYKMS
jgi:hypothetical protein